MTQSQISALTGIPQSTLSYVARGLRELPYQYQSSLLKTYTSEAYRRLRTEGASWIIANRKKWQNPKDVYDDIRMINFKRQELTKGAIAGILKKQGKDITGDNIEELWGQVDSNMIEALQKSKKTLEQWLEDY